MPGKYFLAGVFAAICAASSASATTTGFSYGGHHFGGSYGSHGDNDGGWTAPDWRGEGGDDLFELSRGDKHGDITYERDDKHSLRETFDRLGDRFYTGGKHDDEDDGWTPTGPGPTPSEVPLPAAGWLMLAGLGGIAALKRRAR